MQQNSIQLELRPQPQSPLQGQRFGRLVVTGQGAPYQCPSTKWRYATSICLCDCGQVKTVRDTALKFGHTRSCGCLYREAMRTQNVVHGHLANGKTSKTWLSWRLMRARCFNPTCKDFRNYGGRGITVCKRWELFSNFLADLGEQPRGLSLDRINNDGNYEPGNCRWATRAQQARNTRRNRVFTVRGITACMTDLCVSFHISQPTVWRRIERGWPIERAFLEPAHPTRAASRSCWSS